MGLPTCWRCQLSTAPPETHYYLAVTGRQCLYLRNVQGFPPLQVGTPRRLINEVPVKKYDGTEDNGTTHPQTNLWPRSHPFFICMSMEHTCQRTYADVFLIMKTEHMITRTGILNTTSLRCLKPLITVWLEQNRRTWRRQGINKRSFQQTIMILGTALLVATQNKTLILHLNKNSLQWK